MNFHYGMTGKFYGVCNEYFKIDDFVFKVQEDENDGYRSCLGDILAVNKKEQKNLIFFKTPIATVRIEATTDSYWNQSFEGYNLVDIKDGHVWLKFGTTNYDDYYPCFVFYYQTKGQAIQNLLEL